MDKHIGMDINLYVTLIAQLISSLQWEDHSMGTICVSEMRIVHLIISRFYSSHSSLIAY